MLAPGHHKPDTFVTVAADALAEIVEHGKTGFLVENTTQITEAITQSSSLSSRHCRLAAKTRFSLRQMIEKYFEVFRRLTDSATEVACVREPDGRVDRIIPRNCC